MTLSLDTAYRSFGGEVEASSTPTICRLPDSRRHQLWAIALGIVTVKLCGQPRSRELLTFSRFKPGLGRDKHGQALECRGYQGPQDSRSEVFSSSDCLKDGSNREWGGLQGSPTGATTKSGLAGHRSGVHGFQLDTERQQVACI